jgi:tetratricopeptide (TPR) repeat protein
MGSDVPHLNRNRYITYLELKRFDEALSMFQSCLNLFEKTGDSFSQALSHEFIGKTLLSLNHTDEAYQSLMAAQELYQSIGLMDQAETCQQLMKESDADLRADAEDCQSHDDSLPHDDNLSD